MVLTYNVVVQTEETARNQIRHVDLDPAIPIYISLDNLLWIFQTIM